jgi:hypothetical protein
MSPLMAFGRLTVAAWLRSSGPRRLEQFEARTRGLPHG